MGCAHGKCCNRDSSTSDEDAGHHQRGIRPYKNKDGLTQRSLELVHVPSHNFTLQYSSLTQHGYYPDTTDRENQDSFCIKTQIQAITVLVVGDTLYVANVGDSRAVIAVKDGDRILAEDLSVDQTPFRKDEYDRVKLFGARVLSVDQVEGLKDPDIQHWGDEESHGGDPPRLWVPNGMYPGTAFTRSVGDSTAEKIGVIAVPEISIVRLTPSHLFFVVASDGVFEFLSSQTVVNMATAYKDPSDACTAIAGDSYKRWLELENRTDDITIIIVQIKGLSNQSGVGTTDSEVHSRPCQTGGSMNQSAAIVPPLMHQRPLESIS
ncbi:hypothetical protein V6Z12_A02G054800 [Gossypium hirsutum]